MNEWSDRKVLVVGLGESGYAAARVLLELGATVSVADSAVEPSFAERAHELRAAGATVQLGVSVPGDIKGYEILVASPGVPNDAPVLEQARRSGVNVISEIELGYNLIPNTMVAVTGTNGKTTTTRLIAGILDRPGRRALECGNIGNPLVGLYDKAGPEDILVVEVSSFQLQNIDRFRAHVALALNIAPDHFDWHRNFDEYRRAKMRLVENQGPEDFLIYNIADEFCRELAGQTAGMAIGFGFQGVPAGGLWVEDGWIMVGSPFRSRCRLMPVEEINLKGTHNTLNVMAAAGAALVLGEKPESIRMAVRRFEGLEHRMEFVRRVNDVSFYNDSKATNPHAAISAVRSFDEPMVVIMGGKNKGLLFDELAGELCRRFDTGQLKGVVLVGECASQMQKTISRACGPTAQERIAIEKNLSSSVRKAFQLSNGGGVVLFSPACASFDMFDDYGHRGRVFKDSVNMLEKK